MSGTNRVVWSSFGYRFYIVIRLTLLEPRAQKSTSPVLFSSGTKRCVWFAIHGFGRTWNCSHTPCLGARKWLVEARPATFKNHHWYLHNARGCARNRSFLIVTVSGVPYQSIARVLLGTQGSKDTFDQGPDKQEWVAGSWSPNRLWGSSLGSPEGL